MCPCCRRILAQYKGLSAVTSFWLFAALDANHPAKPASVVLNISKIVEVGSQLLNKTAPGPASSPPPPLPSPPPPLVNPPPPVIPSPPPPPPGPVTNFTVPNIAFKPRAPLSISGTNLVDANGNTVNLHVSYLLICHIDECHLCSTLAELRVLSMWC